ncbi:MAG: ABC transporter ATP-binding protein [Cyanobacteria bacterium P01_A01_bin.135]
MSDAILDVRDLQIRFVQNGQEIRAVDGISLSVERGQTLGIVGESGSGKSVTALAVMGLIPCPPGEITQGEISFCPASSGQNGTRPYPTTYDSTQTTIDLLDLSEKQRQQFRGGEISMIFQEPMSSLNPVFTCGYQLIEAICQHEAISKSKAKVRAITLLQEVKLLADEAQLRRQCEQEWAQDHTKSTPTEADLNAYVAAQQNALLDRYPHELSGGQIQRVMIAMAIACNPALLIADEPTTALDVTVQAGILDLLRELRDRRGMSMIFITHDLGIVAEIADVVAVMYQGKVVEYGPALQIFSAPQHPYTKGLLACRPRPDQQLSCLPTVADFMAITEGRNGETVIKEKGRDLQTVLQQYGSPGAATPGPDAAPADEGLPTEAPILDVQHLRVGFPVKGAFGQVRRYLMAVNDVSFQVYPGETLGLVGESGCGKSTLANALLQLIPTMDGTVTFMDQPINQLSRKALRRLRRDMQIIFQDPFSSLDPRISIGEAVMEPLRIHGQGSGRQRRERVSELLDRVGLNPGCANRYPHEFSGGQRQRICIARALALRPRFIICDESVSALDVSVQAQVLNLLKGIQSEFGLTYIFISHDLGVVKFMSDRIMVMNQGRVEEVGPAEQIYRSPTKEYTRQLIASIPTGSVEAIRERQAQRQAARS